MNVTLLPITVIFQMKFLESLIQMLYLRLLFSDVATHSFSLWLCLSLCLFFLICVDYIILYLERSGHGKRSS